VITEALIIGIIIGILFYEKFDLSPGGVITPGYFALFIRYPGRILITLLIAFLVWLILEFLIKRFILYGRRRFLLALLLGFALKLIMEVFVQPNVQLPFDLISIGYIIPGLIANEMVRQKPVKTFISLGIVTFLTFIVLVVLERFVK
jgi:poly-gamma-glutamate biosynthesis protein PgsC/CapC